MSVSDEHVLRAIGERIRFLRKEQGMTLKDLAYRIGMETSNLSVIENGRSNPQILTYIRIAAALEVDLKELFSLDLKLTGFNESQPLYQPRKHRK
jgi:transcriptional regulator with XRE-family HTH domain